MELQALPYLHLNFRQYCIIQLEILEKMGDITLYWGCHRWVSHLVIRGIGKEKSDRQFFFFLLSYFSGLEVISCPALYNTESKTDPLTSQHFTGWQKQTGWFLNCCYGYSDRLSGSQYYSTPIWLIIPQSLTRQPNRCHHQGCLVAAE